MPSSACKTCARSEEHTSELQSHDNLVCRLLLEKTHTPRRGPPLTPPHSPAARRGVLAGLRAGRRWRGRVASARPPMPLLIPINLFFFKEAAPPRTSPSPPAAASPT